MTSLPFNEFIDNYCDVTFQWGKTRDRLREKILAMVTNEINNKLLPDVERLRARFIDNKIDVLCIREGSLYRIESKITFTSVEIINKKVEHHVQIEWVLFLQMTKDSLPQEIRRGKSRITSLLFWKGIQEEDINEKIKEIVDKLLFILI